MSEESKPAAKMPVPESLILSSSPHVRDASGVPKIMLAVMICLLPACLAGVWFFGFKALKVVVLCTLFCVAFEMLWCKLTGMAQTWRDWSAALTGMILAMNLSADIPWWICAVGAFIAIVIAKQAYGGLGHNPFNPAAVARVALLVGFTGPMTTMWIKPSPGQMMADAVTEATPLNLAKAAIGSAERMAQLDAPKMLMDCFTGNIGGCLGETSAVALLIGGVALIALRIIKWQIPVAVLGTVAVFTGIVHAASPASTPGPLFHILTGGVMIGAFFMATDMVTSPMTNLGALIFGAGIGVITCVIRIWGGFPEGVSFAIVIMNALVPLIDRLCAKRPFGWRPPAPPPAPAQAGAK